MGAPLFMLLRAVVDCKGSKIEHLVARGRIKFARHNTTIFLTVLRRLLRDKSMPVDRFNAVVCALFKRYGPSERGLESAGYKYLNYTLSFIGDVRLEDGHFVHLHHPAIARARDEEFARKKYKKMDRAQVDFLKSLFELFELTKQMRKK